jgi:hypothetical protein
MLELGGSFIEFGYCTENGGRGLSAPGPEIWQYACFLISRLHREVVIVH